MDGNSQWNGKFGDDEMKRRASYGNGSFTGTNSQWGTSSSRVRRDGSCSRPRPSTWRVRDDQHQQTISR